MALKSVNQTFIALVPRLKAPNQLKFRHIILFNIIYKLISKTIANRLNCVCMRLFMSLRVLLS